MHVGVNLESLILNWIYKKYHNKKKYEEYQIIYRKSPKVLQRVKKKWKFYGECIKPKINK